MRTRLPALVFVNFVTFAFWGVPAYSQQEPPAKQSQVAATQHSDAGEGMAKPISIPMARPVTQVHPSPGDASVKRAHPRLGKKFWIPWTMAIAFSIADVELTAHCVHQPGCSERNPLLGQKPSRPELYAIKGAATGLAFYFSRKWKLEGDDGVLGWNGLAYACLGINAFATAWDAHMLVNHREAGAPQTVANVPASEVEIISILPRK